MSPLKFQVHAFASHHPLERVKRSGCCFRHRSTPCPPARSPRLWNPRSFDSNPGFTPHSAALTRQTPLLRLRNTRPS